MSHPELFKELLKELSTVEFLKLILMKMDDINIKTQEELLLLDKVLYKTSNFSKEFKMKLLTPQFQEKFKERMKEIKLDQSNFVNMLKAYEKGKGPYNKSKADIPLSLPPALENAVPKPVPEGPQLPYKPEALPEKTTIAPSSEKRQPSYSNTRRPVEKGNMTPKRARSSSDSSSSSDSDEKEGLHVKISKLQNEIARLNAAKASIDSEQNARASAKYSFTLKKPESSGRTVLMSKDDSYFERSSRAPEPRSERVERENYRDPEMYLPQRSEGRSEGKWEEKKIYRSKTYRPPYPFKR